jgi:hypothetical protein
MERTKEPAVKAPVAPGLSLAEMEAEDIDADTLALEMILMQLRLNEGPLIVDFRRRTGMDPLRLFLQFFAVGERRVPIISDGRIALTRKGSLIEPHRSTRGMRVCGRWFCQSCDCRLSRSES